MKGGRNGKDIENNEPETRGPYLCTKSGGLEGERDSFRVKDFQKDHVQFGTVSRLEKKRRDRIRLWAVYSAGFNKMRVSA